MISYIVIKTDAVRLFEPVWL